MPTRYLEAMQCLDLIAPERLAEAHRIADARAGLQSFQEGCDSRLMEIVFSVPHDQFRWFRIVLRKMAERHERRKSMLSASGSQPCIGTTSQSRQMVGGTGIEPVAPPV